MLYQPELRSCKAGFGRIPGFLSVFAKNLLIPVFYSR